ncbi:unnamed protein product [Polarella glacialis]|uniref:Uncharacterized protein n=1 Tax=Polarella glacialis TaxID=89957 RepID=A0A813D6W4_POLGL|nr:unnamed protein product [Polarella glacialis]
MPVSSKIKQVMLEALAVRCQRLEQQTSTLLDDDQLHIAVPAEPRTGLFSAMADQDLGAEVLLSSVHRINGVLSPKALLFLRTSAFGTEIQTSDNPPWIELGSTTLAITPEGIGLKHGWSSSWTICKDFVVEAALDTGDWHELLRCVDRPLSSSGEIFAIREEQHGGKWFNRFRIRMTGPTYEWLLGLTFLGEREAPQTQTCLPCLSRQSRRIRD